MSRTIIDVVWHPGEPCPVCGEEVCFGDMLEHMGKHERTTGIMFLRGVLYTSAYRLEDVQKEGEPKDE